MFISVHLEDAQMAMIVLAAGTGIESISWAGFAINHLDIAPRYASLLFGITNTMATIPGILSPLLVGAITGDGVNKLDIANEMSSATALLSKISD